MSVHPSNQDIYQHFQQQSCNLTGRDLNQGELGLGDSEVTGNSKQGNFSANQVIGISSGHGRRRGFAGGNLNDPYRPVLKVLKCYPLPIGGGIEAQYLSGIGAKMAG